MDFAALSSRLIPETPPGPLRSAAALIGALGLAALLRWLLLAVSTPAFPGATFFPAILAVSVYAGLRWGIGALAGATVLSWVLLGRAQGVGLPHARELAGLIIFAASGMLCVLAAVALRRAVLDLRTATSARERAEAALAGHAARLRLAEEAGGLGLWEWNLETGEATLSQGADGKPRDLEGPDYFAFLKRVHPEDQAALRAATREAIISGRLFDHEYRLTNREGGERWIHTRGEVVRDPGGRAIRILGYNFDVTERRLSEDRLRESEARFRTLADSAPVPMWVTRIDRRREFVNKAYFDLLGLPFQEAVDLDWRTILHPDDIERITAESIAGEASRQPFVLEGRYRIRGESYRWMRSFSQPRWGAGGELAGFIGIAVDVTDSKRAEADLTRLNELLAERVQEALAERDQAQAALMQSQKLEAVGQLTGGVAHDFNNLLTVVIGALDIVARHPDDTTRRTRLLDAALSAARRGERLTQQLLAFARRQPLKTETVRVDELIRQDEPLFRRAVGEAVRFQLTLKAEGRAATLDTGQFEAALLNLVVNARDATPDGGTIGIETDVITLTAPQGEAQPGDYLKVTVSDSGPGMASDVQARAFEPFFTTKAVGKGTGLGLSQVYGFARQSGGDAQIESRPGQGARVSLLLPLSAAPATAPEPAPAPAAEASLTVLLVEDDADVGDLIDTMLAELGHRVRRADTADRALAVLGAHQDIDLLLTDVIMPGGKSGVDLAREVAKVRPGLPVILSSGYTGDSLATAEAAPWPLLRKPYTLQALAAALSEAMKARAADTTPA